MKIIYWGNPYPANTVTISFEANPSTGYTWICEMNPEGIVKIVDDYYVPDTSPAPAAGMPGTYNFIIAPVSDGKTKLTFYYLRVWEGKESAAEIISYYVTVKNKFIHTIRMIYN